jgi:hypothetical protein
MGLMDTPKGTRLQTAMGEPEARSGNRQAHGAGTEANAWA